MIIVATVLIYFLVLLGFSRLTAHRADNDTFYRANRRSYKTGASFFLLSKLTGAAMRFFVGIALTSPKKTPVA